MPRDSAKAIFEVRAGLIPGTADPEHTRRWVITSGEWEAADEKGEADLLLMEVHFKAVAYCQILQALCASGRSVNWTDLTFLWP